MAKSYLESLLGEREKIILSTQQHWFILFGSIALEIILILLVFIATITATVFFPEYVGLIIAIGFFVLLLPIATMTKDILSWTNRQYIITSRRVIQISGIFNKNVTDSSLEKVNDVHMVQSALGRIFDYGDIEILTASELGVNLLKRIESPLRYKKAMIDAKAQLEGYNPSQELPPEMGEAAPATGVAAVIGQLDQLRQQGLLTDEEFQLKKTEILERL